MQGKVLLCKSYFTVYSTRHFLVKLDFEADEREGSIRIGETKKTIREMSGNGPHFSMGRFTAHSFLLFSNAFVWQKSTWLFKVIISSY